jgi:hypothetical protein
LPLRRTSAWIERNRTMDMPPMIVGNPAMINAYKSGILKAA